MYVSVDGIFADFEHVTILIDFNEMLPVLVGGCVWKNAGLPSFNVGLF